jgi:CNT family concentrative nucleoside transporter
MDMGRSVLGVVVLLLLAYAISDNRRLISPRTVLAALATQIGIGALILFVPAGRAVLSGAAIGVNHVIDYGNAGIAFVFGGLVKDRMMELFGGDGYVFGLRVLPMIIFMTSLIAVLYHLGIMRWVVLGLGVLFQKLLGVTRLESFSAVTTIFLGQSEMPAVVKPFVPKMTGPELYAVMTSGMSAVTGSVLAGYAGLGVRMDYLIAASFMAIPGGLMFAKIACPTTGPSEVEIRHLSFDEKRATNIIEAAGSGAMVGVKIAVAVGAMLIAYIGLIALLNGIVGGIGDTVGLHDLSLELILGKLFSPIAYMIGVPWDQASLAGSFIGQKMILNEFVAYINLSPYLKDAASLAAAGKQVLDARSLAIVSFALCGFANFSSIAILVGGFGTICPERRAEVARYGLRVVACGTLSNLMSANIAGFFLSLN